MSVTNTVNNAANAVNNAANAANNAANAANNATSGTTGTTGSTGTSSVAGSTASLNSSYNEFLTLLTTQLQNQDPTSPVDTSQMTSEIAQLSQVQQQIDTNSYLQQLVSLFGASQTSNAVSYIGTQIQATGNQTNLANGQASIEYNLPSAAASAQVTITDASGNTVFTGTGTTSSGLNQMYWNGEETSGSTAPSGAYTFSVTAKDANGNALTPTTYTSGVVTSVDTQNGTTTLQLGNVSVPLSSVQQVSAPATIANTGTTGSTS